MSDNVCSVCGADDHECKGTAAVNEHQIIDFTGVRTTSERMRAPMQHVRDGRAGYIGDVELYEPTAPGVRLVQIGDGDEAADVPATSPEKRTKKAR